MTPADLNDLDRPHAHRLSPDARRRAILEVAREVFLREGYAAASMAAIAARCGGSKGTLYNYFPSKEDLFAAIVRAEAEREAWDERLLTAPDVDLPSALSAMGRRVLRLILGEPVLSLHRLVIAEGGRFPELGRAFYEAGPRRCLELVAERLASDVGRGRLRPLDPEHAAAQFLELCKAGLHQKRLWGVAEAPTAEEIERNVASAVRVFLAAYGAEAPGPR